MATQQYTSTTMTSSRPSQTRKQSTISLRPRQLRPLSRTAFKCSNSATTRSRSTLTTEQKKSCKYLLCKFNQVWYRFPDGTIKCIFADGEEESIFTDGTIQRIEKSGIKAIEYASGQKDILYPDGTRVREYPDGRIKKTYPDGTIETSIKDQN